MQTAWKIAQIPRNNLYQEECLKFPSCFAVSRKADLWSSLFVRTAAIDLSTLEKMRLSIWNFTNREGKHIQAFHLRLPLSKKILIRVKASLKINLKKIFFEPIDQTHVITRDSGILSKEKICIRQTSSIKASRLTNRIFWSSLSMKRFSFSMK